MSLESLMTSTVFFLKTTAQLSSQICPVDTKVELLRAGRTLAFCACKVNSEDKGMIDVLVDLVVVASGRVTDGPVPGCTLHTYGSSDSLTKWPLAPLS